MWQWWKFINVYFYCLVLNQIEVMSPTHRIKIKQGGDFPKESIMRFFLPSFCHFQDQVCIALGEFILLSVLHYVHCMHC